MFLRFSQTLLIYFLLFSYVESAESGGMPQLNPEFWFSQIFWLIITFGIMFILLSKLVLPKISENLEDRKAQISENIESAEKQREESDKKLKEYEQKEKIKQQESEVLGQKPVNYETRKEKSLNENSQRL